MANVKKTNQKGNGYRDYEDRFDTTKELDWDTIEEMIYNAEQGRTDFPCYVLDASDFLDPGAGTVQGTYVVAVLRPAYYDHMSKPGPCEFDDPYERFICLSDHPVAFSETKAGDTRTMQLSPGDTVTGYWEDGPQYGGKMRRLRFYLDKVTRKNAGHYDFKCLEINERKTNLTYNSNSNRSTGGGNIPNPTTQPFSINKHPDCFQWKNSSKKYNAKVIQNKYGVPTGGLDTKVFNGLFNQLPNCKNCYRGGQFRKESLVHEINALKELGVRIIYRFNAMGKGYNKQLATVEDERATAEAAGMQFVFIPLTGGTILKKSQWETLKDELVKGGVYFHCHAGVDRTGAVAARWILETSMALEGVSKLDDARRKEVWNYTTSHGGAWLNPHLGINKDKTPVDKGKGPNGSKKGKRSRTDIRDSSKNKAQKDWAFDVDTGYNPSKRGSGFKYGDLHPDKARALAAIANCKDIGGQ